MNWISRFFFGETTQICLSSLVGEGGVKQLSAANLRDGVEEEMQYSLLSSSYLLWTQISEVVCFVLFFFIASFIKCILDLSCIGADANAFLQSFSKSSTHSPTLAPASMRFSSSACIDAFCFKSLSASANAHRILISAVLLLSRPDENKKGTGRWLRQHLFTTRALKLATAVERSGQIGLRSGCFCKSFLEFLDLP